MSEFKRLLEELRKLNLPKDQFAIFGSGPMGARGLKKCNDIDIIVKKDLWNDLIKKYPLKKDGDDRLLIGNIDVFKRWSPGEWNVDLLIENADIINKIRFVKLKEVLKWKKKYNREKDIKDIKLIKKYFKENE